jgi:hypothetical protein
VRPLQSGLGLFLGGINHWEKKELAATCLQNAKRFVGRMEYFLSLKRKAPTRSVCMEAHLPENYDSSLLLSINRKQGCFLFIHMRERLAELIYSFTVLEMIDLKQKSWQLPT